MKNNPSSLEGCSFLTPEAIIPEPLSTYHSLLMQQLYGICSSWFSGVDYTTVCDGHRYDSVCNSIVLHSASRKW